MAKVPSTTSTRAGKPIKPADTADSPLRKAARKVAGSTKADDKPAKVATPAATSARKPRAAKATAPAKSAPPAKPAKAATPVEPEVVAAPAAAGATPAKPLKPAKPAKTGKAAKPGKDKAKGARKSALREASARIAQLAADILEDRIVPTIEQIKALAASALGDQGKAKKPKRKKK